MKESKKYIPAILFLVCIIMCCGPNYLIAKTTGQSCLDMMSGQVPDKAEARYFEMLFTAVENEDYEIASDLVGSEKALDDLKDLQLIISSNYEIIWGDDLANEYERVFMFDNGQKVYINFSGRWAQCPDFNVTDEEVKERIELNSIELEVEAE